MPDLGSDHFGVLFTIVNSSNTAYKSSDLRFNTKKANWDLFKDTLISSFIYFLYKLKNTYNSQELDDLAKEFTNKIVNAANISIPKAIIMPNAKPW